MQAVNQGVMSLNPAQPTSFRFCHYVFKKSSAAKVSESVYMRERVNSLRGKTVSCLERHKNIQPYFDTSAADNF